MLTLSLWKIQKRYCVKAEQCCQNQNKSWQLNSKIILALMVGQVVDEEEEKRKRRRRRNTCKKSKDGRCCVIIFEKGSVIEKGKLVFFFNLFFLMGKLLKSEGG